MSEDYGELVFWWRRKFVYIFDKI